MARAAPNLRRQPKRLGRRPWQPTDAAALGPSARMLPHARMPWLDPDCGPPLGSRRGADATAVPAYPRPRPIAAARRLGPAKGSRALWDPEPIRRARHPRKPYLRVQSSGSGTAAKLLASTQGTAPRQGAGRQCVIGSGSEQRSCWPLPMTNAPNPFGESALARRASVAETAGGGVYQGLAARRAAGPRPKASRRRAANRGMAALRWTQSLSAGHGTRAAKQNRALSPKGTPALGSARAAKRLDPEHCPRCQRTVLRCYAQGMPPSWADLRKAGPRPALRRATARPQGD